MTQRYDGIAGIYDANRARYPQELMEKFRDLCRMPEGGGIVLDVGAGTGISTRQLRSGQVVKMPKASFIDWSFTSTKMQECIANAGEERMQCALDELMERYFGQETAVEILYETQLFIARRDQAGA
jgi:hypothetical protein